MKSQKTIQTETVILVFTDIEGSTRLASQLKDEFSDLMDLHNGIIRSEITNCNGIEADNAGDGFFVIFYNINDTIQFVLKAQKAIALATWPGDFQVKVRMGLHIGEVYKKDEIFSGEEVNRCSRICDACNGGQVLLSKDIASLFNGKAPKGVY